MNLPLLTTSYFTGELLIPGIHGSTDAEIANAYELQVLINDYEEEYLRYLLGDDLFELFEDGLATDDPMYLALKDQIYWQKTYNRTTPVSFTDISVDTEFTGVVPAGYILEYVVIDNGSGTAAVLSMGTTSGAYDVFESYGISPNGLTSIPVGRALSMSAVTSLFLNDNSPDDDWGGAILDIYLVMSPLSSSVPVPAGTSTVQFYSPAANYVYYRHRQNAATQTGPNGEVKPNQENGEQVTSGHKMVRAWNKMCKMSLEIRNWMIDNDTYDYDFTMPADDIFEYQNQWGI